jgi:hypothetical protein
MIYVVMGMHKSGTTLVSQALHESGIHMGDFDESLDYDRDNKFERHVTQEINRMMLDGFLIPPLDYLARRRNRPVMDQAGYRRNKDSLAIARYGSFLRKYKDDTPPILAETVQSLSSQHENWGFKDPRTCLTYPLWKRALPEHRLVVVYRHFSPLIRRYRASRWNLPRLYRVLYSWTLHNHLVYRHLQQAEQPALVLSYEKLMEDNQEYERLDRFIGGGLVDVRDPGLYRRRTQNHGEDYAAFIRLLSPFLPANPGVVFSQLESYRSKALLANRQRFVPQQASA